MDLIPVSTGPNAGHSEDRVVNQSLFHNLNGIYNDFIYRKGQLGFIIESFMETCFIYILTSKFWNVLRPGWCLAAQAPSSSPSEETTAENQ